MNEDKGNFLGFIFPVLIGLVFVAGIIAFSYVIYWAGKSDSENREIKYQQNSLIALTNEQVAAQGKTCTDAGLGVRIHSDFISPTQQAPIRVECTNPPDMRPRGGEEGFGVGEAALTAGGVYLGGKVLGIW